MSVKELIEELSKLPPDDTLCILYFHEDKPEDLYGCDVHDFCVGNGTLKGTSYLEIVGRDEAERDDSVAIKEKQDVVPVTRCKDCKHCYYADNRIPNQRVYVCGYFGFDIGDWEIPSRDFYCAMGERK